MVSFWPWLRGAFQSPLRHQQSVFLASFYKMILDRQFTPTEGELIYHYCRAEAFLDIIKTRSIWQSAYYVLNDSMERKWGYSIFTKAAKKLHDEVGADCEIFLKRVDGMIRMAYTSSIAMISSYSLDGDVLSQWRGYAT